jgi:hypothetical protein
MREERTRYLHNCVCKKLQEPRLCLRKRIEKRLGPASQLASPGPDRNMKNIQGDPVQHAEVNGKTTVALLTEALGSLVLCNYADDAAPV